MQSKFTRKKFLKLGLFAFVGLMAATLFRMVTQPFWPAAEKNNLDDAPGDTAENYARPGTPGKTEQRKAKEEATEKEQNQWKRKLGKTGEMVSLFGIGGAGIIADAGKEEEAVAILERALDRGINYIDTAPSYADGTSERHIGIVMENRRDEAFLATKTLDRSYDGTMKKFESSLKRLRTDYLDLYQIHGIRDEGEAEEVMREDGAVRALKKLQEEGAVRYTGVTGHRSPQALRYLLERQEFDCVMIPLNPADIYYASFQKELLEYAVQKEMGIIAMKVVSYGRLLREDGIASMKDALGYVCTLPIHTAIAGLSSQEELEENIDICQNFSPFSKEKMAELENLAQPYQQEANFYKEW